MATSDRKKTGSPARKLGRGKESGTGAFAGTQHGGENEGVSSAKPQVITGREDATFSTDPDNQDRGEG